MAMSKQRRALAAALEALDRADMNGLPGLTPAYIAIGEALAELEQSTAVEPAQAVHVKENNGFCAKGELCDCGGDVPRVREGCSNWRKSSKTPTQAVKTFWASENILKEYLRDNISCVLTTTKCAANTVPLYTTPPAIVEAVPVGRVLHWKGDPGFAPKTCIRGFDEFPQGYAQLGPWEEGENVYTAPPAIDETRHKLILVCEYLETVGLMFVSPRVISSQIRAILEAGNGE